MRRYYMWRRQLSYTCFDAAAAPLIMALVGLPLLLIAVVVLIIVFTVKQIRKQRKSSDDIIK